MYSPTSTSILALFDFEAGLQSDLKFHNLTVGNFTAFSNDFEPIQVADCFGSFNNGGIGRFRKTNRGRPY